MLSRMRDRLVDGLLLALPLALVFVLLHKVVGVIAQVLAPGAHLFPLASGYRLIAVDIAAIVVLLLALVATGIFARSRPGKRLSDAIERTVLRKIPGFLLYKSVLAGFSTEERETGFTPALVAFDDNTVLGFIVEQANPVVGMVTVFVPAAPTPAAGSVVLVAQSRVTPLAVSVASALHTVTRLGLGLQQLAHAESPPRREA